MATGSSSTWALILAGGDGVRLRPLTTQIAGDARPKQFCALLDGETLLDRTRRRADLVARFDRNVVVVSRPHEPYYRGLAADLAPGRLVVQPHNRGTAPGILYPMLRIRELAGDPTVAVFPSDHYVGDEPAFVSYVVAAGDVVAHRPDLVILLGVQADRPETEYGWIGPAEAPLPVDGEPAFPIRRFWEKPSPRLAQHLWRRGCLWNSFVMVGRVTAFLDLVRVTAPDLYTAFASVRAALGSPGERHAIEALYAGLPTLSFSDCVLARGVERLATVRVKSVEWSDWGHPARVLASLKRTGREPAWLRRVELASIA
ncbi:MAG: NTP transferase domain-containing protein [Candidatus Rokubacteria bacterium]|nr:NTP transferase domain-containing protein [Candidatus Rokubacteria bacterium]